MRSRNIKPGFFTNEDLVELPFEYRLLFQGLWMMADAMGRLEDRPKRIKMNIFPVDNVDVESGLDALEKSTGQFIKRYNVNGTSIIQVRNFEKHQNPHINEKRKGSVFPEYIELVSDKYDTSTIQEPCKSGGILNPESGILNEEPCLLKSDSSESNDKASKPEIEPEGFLKFWDKYPRIRRAGRAESLKFWKANKLESKFDEVMAGLDRWIVSHEWVKDGGTYVKQTDGWLKGKKWIDEPMPASEAPPPKQPYQIHSTALPGNQITPAYKRQAGVIDIS